MCHAQGCDTTDVWSVCHLLHSSFVFYSLSLRSEINSPLPYTALLGIQHIIIVIIIIIIIATLFSTWYYLYINRKK